MVNVYLFIELLGAANADLTIAELQKLELSKCKFAKVVALSDEKLVAQLNCESAADAGKAVFDKISPVEGVVQTNIIAVVTPKK